MKKKLLAVTLLLTGLFIFTGCSKKENITIKDNILKYTTTFEYNKEDGFKFKKKVKGGRFSEIIFTNKKENLEYDMYYSESTSISSDKIKTNRKKDKNYKEYKFGEYDAYTYGDYNNSLNLIITLKSDIKEKHNVELFVSINKIKDTDDKKVSSIFKDKINQDFFSSIKNTVD